MQARSQRPAAKRQSYQLSRGDERLRLGRRMVDALRWIAVKTAVKGDGNDYSHLLGGCSRLFPGAGERARTADLLITNSKEGCLWCSTTSYRLN